MDSTTEKLNAAFALLTRSHEAEVKLETTKDWILDAHKIGIPDSDIVRAIKKLLPELKITSAKLNQLRKKWANKGSNLNLQVDDSISESSNRVEQSFA